MRLPTPTIAPDQPVDIAHADAVYRRTRRAVFEMLEAAGPEREAALNARGGWLNGDSNYLFDAGPEVLARLRQHCHQFNGIREYDYRSHREAARQQFASKLDRLKAEDSVGLFVPEAPQLGGFGFRMDDGLVNADTLKYYEALIAMERAVLLEQFKDRKKRSLVIEFGGAWGGFSWAFKNLFSNSTYVIVGQPAAFLFSATYLGSLYPDSKIKFVTKQTGETPDWEEYDFVFVPEYLMPFEWLARPELVVSMASFDVLSDTGVARRVASMAQLDPTFFYALENFTTSRKHWAGERALDVVSPHFWTYSVEILDVDFTRFDKAADRDRYQPPIKPDVQDYNGDKARFKLDRQKYKEEMVKRKRDALESRIIREKEKRTGQKNDKHQAKNQKALEQKELNRAGQYTHRFGWPRI